MIIVKKKNKNKKTNDLFFKKFGLKQFNLAKKKRKSPTVSSFTYNYLIIVIIIIIIIIITITIIKILNDYFQSFLLFTSFRLYYFNELFFNLVSFVLQFPRLCSQ